MQTISVSVGATSILAKTKEKRTEKCLKCGSPVFKHFDKCPLCNHIKKNKQVDKRPSLS